MKTSISKLAILLIILLLISAVILSFLIPKSIFIDRFLMSRGIYIIPARVEEDIFSVSFEGLRIFYGNRKVGEFSKARIDLAPTAIELSAVCGKGRIKAVFGLRSLNLDIHSANCFEDAGSVSGKLELKERDLRGDLIVRDLHVKEWGIDSLKLTFKGRNFEGEIEYMGMKLVGGGSIKPDMSKIENWEIKGEFRGSVGKLVVKGKLNNITAQLR